MVTTQTQIRRDTATNLNAATPADGELGYDTTNKRLVIGDGSTAGGTKIPSAKDLQNSSFIYSTVGGTANAITLTNSPAVSSYSSGLSLRFKASSTNTSSTTANVDGLGTKNIYKLSGTSLVALTGNEIITGVIYEITYDGTNFQLTNSGSGGGASNIQAFTSSGTWTKPSGYSSDAMVLMEGIGGGGAGGNSGVTGANGGDTTITAWLLAGGGGGGTSAGVGGTGGKGAGQHGGTGGNVNANGGHAGYSGGGGGGSGSGLGGTGVTGALGGAGGNAGASGSSYGGGGGGDSTGGGGGGGGGYSYRWARYGDVSATETITIGAGGSGGSRSGAAGWARLTVFG